MKKLLTPLLLTLLVVMLTASSVSVVAYSGGTDYFVVDIPYHSEQDITYLTTRYDVWHIDRQSGIIRLMLDQSEYHKLASQGYSMLIDQVETQQVNQPLIKLPGQINGISEYPCYRTVEETYQSAEMLVATYPELARWVSIGESWEKITPGGAAGYDLKVLVLSNQQIQQEKPKVLISSGVHARELAPVELNTRLAEYLLANYGVDADITWLLDYHEIHLLLIANPDGRKKAESGLSWRKNTNENYCGSTSSSRGADLNRNFPFHWGGASTNPCDITYQGPVALSEPESQALKAYELLIFPDQRGPNDNDPAPLDATGLYIDLHSYGEDVLWPYGFDYTSTAPNNTQLRTLGRKLAYFNDYSPSQASALYAATGATDDDAYGTLGIAAYTIEMGTEFFQGCSDFENTILPDNLEALKYGLKVARTPYQTPAGPDTLNLVAPTGSLPLGHVFTVSASINDTRYQTPAEPRQNISAAQYSIDQPPWEAGCELYPMSAQDGSFNANIETVTALVDPAGLSGGKHILYVQGQDAEGNWGAVSAVFFEMEYGYYFPISYR